MMPWELEHILRAAGDMVGEKTFIVIGSQAIIGSFQKGVDFERLPSILKMSIEVDLIPENEDLWEIVERDLGANSLFAEQHGYYADGVDRSTAILPAGWEDRLIPFKTPQTHGVTGLCLEIHDLFISKLIAGRQKDRIFCRQVIALGMVDESVLLERLDRTYNIVDSVREICNYKIINDFETYCQAQDLLHVDDADDDVTM